MSYPSYRSTYGSSYDTPPSEASYRPSYDITPAEEEALYRKALQASSYSTPAVAPYYTQAPPSRYTMQRFEEAEEDEGEGDEDVEDVEEEEEVDEDGGEGDDEDYDD
jgi:hypothetical protein